MFILAQCFDELNAIHSGHVQVNEQYARRRGFRFAVGALEDIQRIQTVHCPHDGMDAHAFPETTLYGLRVAIVVFYQQDAERSRKHMGTSRPSALLKIWATQTSDESVRKIA